jgi:hypothetical protein
LFGTIEMMMDWVPIFREVGQLVENSMFVKKASEQTIIALQSLYHGSVGYQYMRIRIDLSKKVKFLQMQLRTQARARKNVAEIADECISSRMWGFTNR